jgi:hypothetical protein
MPPFPYRCPNTGLRVQGFIAEEVQDDTDRYEPINCLACQQVHYVVPNTGKVLGQESE